MRRRRLGLIVPSITVVAITGVVLLVQVGESPAERRAAEAAPQRPEVTAPVAQQVLRDVVTVTAKVQKGAAIPVNAQVPGGVVKGVVTTAGPGVGTQIDHGSLLVGVSGQPMFVLRGQLPLYRDLAPGATGPDVEVLQNGLRDAGFRVGDPAGVYGTATATAAQKLWEKHGFAPMTDPTLEQQLADARQQLAQTPTEQADTRQALGETIRDLKFRSGARVPMTSVVIAPALPAVVVASDAGLGKEVAPGAVVLELSTAPPVLVAKANATQAQVFQAGQRFKAALAGKPAAGKVQAVSAPDEQQMVTVTLAADVPIPFDQLGTDVVVEIELLATAGEVLVVPASALRTGGDATDHVIRVNGPDAAQPRERITVTIGVQGAGLVEITEAKPALQVGDDVLVGDDD